MADGGAAKAAWAIQISRPTNDSHVGTTQVQPFVRQKSRVTPKTNVHHLRVGTSSSRSFVAHGPIAFSVDDHVPAPLAQEKQTRVQRCHAGQSAASLTLAVRRFVARARAGAHS